ncbi:TldD/PmbA family protein [Saccharibacter floricola]|uniref:Zinc-dependent microcin-processing U62/PmbA/TldD n=1 Tax=Saccharibacter floricola DSM 15669 TaxID=1123227 RepID=A0ABQ0NYP4_9PROT|nr:TldD/PmbA family protein [Saccharibacter floricola]GBQ06719.1 zinc-dependent microcin-processing U62/PmbA/TldD [Saccharibacter floricola DSM 15669]
MNDFSSLLQQALQAAKRNGADHADVVATRSHSQSAMVRQGKAEGIKHADNISLGLRVFRGQRIATVSGNDVSSNALDQLAERACAMAKIVPPSPYDGLADHPLEAPDQALIRSLDMFDDSPAPDTARLLDKALEMERAALSHKGITNSSGASASAGRTDIALATSGGFYGAYQRSQFGLGVSVLAGEGDKMERDYAFHSTLHQTDLRTPEALGHEAAERALARLNPGRPKTGHYPVIFDRRISSSLLGHLASAINGAAIARGSSFLKDKMGQSIFADGITITDDPTLARQAGSRPFDGEGCATSRLNIVENGVLNHWLLDSRCARQLSLTPNGRAVRSLDGSVHPSSSNLFLQTGSVSVEELCQDIKEGVLITELMGNAINMLTGDYSRGASGFMIRNGHKAEAVSGLTIAGNLHEMFTHLRPADDLQFDQAVNAPSIRLDSMTIAGE